MERGNLSRRGFMQQSLAAMTAAGLPLWYARETFAADEDKRAKDKKEPSPSDRTVLGVIGIGSPQSRGRAILGDALRDKSVQCVAVCDVDDRHCDCAARELRKLRRRAALHPEALKVFRQIRHALGASLRS